jgi:hypothetical protein
MEEEYVNITSQHYLPYSLDMIENKSYLTIDIMSKNENCMLNALVAALDNKINIKKLKDFLLKNKSLDLININTRRRETNKVTKSFLENNIKKLSEELMKKNKEQQRLKEKYNYYNKEGNTGELSKLDNLIFKLENDIPKLERNLKSLNNDLSNLKTIRRRDIFDDNCWFNSELIKILEEYLNIKIIVINNTRWKQEFNTELFFCDKLSLSEGSAESNNYVVLIYNDNNYDLLRYNNKGILNFQELPEELKINCFSSGGRKKINKKSRKVIKKHKKKSKKSKKY